MASNPMQQFTVHRIGPEIKIAGIDCVIHQREFIYGDKRFHNSFIFIYGFKRKKLFQTKYN